MDVIKPNALSILGSRSGKKLSDPMEAKAYLEVSLEDLHKEGDREGFLLALRDVTEAQGGITHLLEKTKLKPTGVYKAVSENGNPTLSTLDRILGGLGLRLSIEPADSPQTQPH